jgi:parallel beta-helix repeat protein
MGWRRIVWRMGFAALALLIMRVLVASGAFGQSGDTWIVTTDTTLDSDFTGTVFIEGDDVVFDCAGHMLRPSPTSQPSSWGVTGVIIDGRSRVSVVNCVLDNYQTGIDVEGSTLVTIKDLIVDGVGPGSGFGIRVKGSSQVAIVGNAITNFEYFPGPCHGPCGWATGVDVTESSDVEIRSNSSSSNGHGFYVSGSVRVDVADNVADSNLSIGFTDRAPATNTYVGNTCHDNFGRGSSPVGLCDWGVSDRVGFFDPLSGRWHVPDDSGAAETFYFGVPGDIPLVGAWGNFLDTFGCDFDPTPGVYRRSETAVYLRTGNKPDASSLRYRIGDPGDIPLAGDFDGQGCDTVSLYRPSTQQFFIFNHIGRFWFDDALTEADYVFQFGNPDDIPVVGDWDGDGIDEIGLHRPSTGEFYWRNTLDTGVADGMIYYGNPGDRFVAGDWVVVDAFDTPGVFRPSDTTVYLRHTLTQGPADNHYPAGEPAWIPITVTSAIADNSNSP